MCTWESAMFDGDPQNYISKMGGVVKGDLGLSRSDARTRMAKQQVGRMNSAMSRKVNIRHLQCMISRSDRERQ